MLLELAAIFAATAVWLSATSLYPRIRRLVIKSLPAGWRDHPELAAGYEAAARARLVDLKDEAAPLLAWFAALTGFFALMAALGASLAALLIACVALAAYLTSRALDADADEARRFRLDMAALPRNRLRATTYRGSLLLSWLGFVAAACLQDARSCKAAAPTSAKGPRGRVGLHGIS